MDEPKPRPDLVVGNFSEYLTIAAGKANGNPVGILTFRPRPTAPALINLMISVAVLERLWKVIVLLLARSPRLKSGHPLVGSVQFLFSRSEYMAKKQLPILFVVQIGESDFERYVIEDQQDRVWTGERFDSQGAALFARHNDAATETQNILKRNFNGVEPQRYVVPLYVEVYSYAEPVPLAEVAKYLSEASRLYLNTTDHGNGPSDSLVLPRIEWHRMKQESPDE